MEMVETLGTWIEIVDKSFEKCLLMVLRESFLTAQTLSPSCYSHLQKIFANLDN